MCWGFWPTFTFVLGEATVLAVLFLRNQLNDRRNVFFHMPFLTQEAIQLMIWASLAADLEATSNSCRTENRVLSLVECVVVEMVPGWFALFATFGQPEGRVGRRRIALLWSWAILCLYFTLASLVVVLFAQLVGWCPLCTTPGPWGHQRWPFLQLRPQVLPIVQLGCYIVLMCPPLFHVAHISFAPLTIAAIWWMPSALYIFIGDEWGSVWCFTASVLCVAYLFEPMCLSKLVPNLQSREAASRLDDAAPDEDFANRSLGDMLYFAIEDVRKVLADTVCTPDKTVVFGLPTSRYGQDWPRADPHVLGRHDASSSNLPAGEAELDELIPAAGKYGFAGSSAEA